MSLFDSVDEGEAGSTRFRRVKQEIDSWRPYAEALRQEDRQVLREMLNTAAASYCEAVERAERGYDTESLLMSIVLSQQKAINWLSNLAKRLREESEVSKIADASRSAPP
jgi:hypothetical protein